MNTDKKLISRRAREIVTLSDDYRPVSIVTLQTAGSTLWEGAILYQRMNDQSPHAFACVYGSLWGSGSRFQGILFNRFPNPLKAKLKATSWWKKNTEGLAKVPDPDPPKWEDMFIMMVDREGRKAAKGATREHEAQGHTVQCDPPFFAVWCETCAKQLYAPVQVSRLGPQVGTT